MAKNPLLQGTGRTLYPGLPKGSRSRLATQDNRSCLWRERRVGAPQGKDSVPGKERRQLATVVPQEDKEPCREPETKGSREGAHP